MASPLVGSGLDRLLSIKTDLNHDDPMQEVNKALQECHEVLRQWHAGVSSPQPMNVFPSAVMYESAAQREQKWNLYLKNNPEIANKYTPADWDEEKAAFGILGDATKESNQRSYTIYVTSIQNIVFSYSWHARVWGEDTPELREKFYRGDNEWHEFVVVIQQRKAYIYDPSYIPLNTAGRRNLKSVPLVGTKAYKVIIGLKNRDLRVDEIWVGGGGNDTGRCRAMSLKWIRDGVEEMITTERWQLGSGWERVNFA